VIKAVIFDCFGVLYVDSSHYFFEHNLDNYDELLSDILELNAIYDRGLVSFDQHVDSLAELTGLDKSFIAENFEAKVQLNKKLLDYSQKLRNRYKVGMLSNMGVGSMNKFFSTEEREQLFDVVILSSEVGMVKPEVGIYRLVADRLGVNTAECIMIDDSAANCAGAEAAGMKSVLYTGTKQASTGVEKIIEKTA
jgi:HAD superfamily hydrolase (TIGR01509 family)